VGVQTNPFEVTLNISLYDENNNPLAWSLMGLPGGANPPYCFVGGSFGHEVPADEPTITSPATGQLVLSWTAAQTTALTSAEVWYLSVYIGGVGPLTILTGNLTCNPPTDAGSSAAQVADLSVFVEGGLATVTATVGGMALPNAGNTNVVAASGTALTIPAPATYNANDVTLSGDVVYTFPALPSAGSNEYFLLKVNQPSSGGPFTETFPTGTVFDTTGDTQPTAPSAGSFNLYNIYSIDGAAWHVRPVLLDGIAPSGGGGVPAGGGGVPAATAAGQTIISGASNEWELTTAATVDTVNTPQADTQAGSPGSNPSASSSNHAHPLSLLGRSMLFSPLFAPNYANDLTLDGTTTFANAPEWGWSTLQPITLSGSTYSAKTGWDLLGIWGPNYSGCRLIAARNITLDAGISLEPDVSGGTLILSASQAITINGTINCSGANASGASGGSPAANASNVWAYCGYPGADGGTGSATTNNNTSSWGAPGGAGGNAGSNTGGKGALNGSAYFGFFWSLESMLFLMGWGGDIRTLSQVYPYGGNQGGAGAGDGYNSGGGGGQGGGMIILIAPSITLGAGAVLNVSGGAGGNGSVANSSGAGSGGGGGGGNGIIAMHALEYSISSTASLLRAGGAGGAGAGTGSPGAAGQSNGGLLSDPPVVSGGFGYGGGCFINQWQ